jgi:crossover junction endonuclease MUS81
MKRLPVGDGIWIARHRRSHTEYVLDFIVERKGVTDLVNSIRDSRYKDQKLRLKVPSELLSFDIILFFSFRLTP